MEWVQVDFPSLIPELLDGHIDIIAAGLFVTPERADHVLFSMPTARVCAGLLMDARDEVVRDYAGLAARPDLHVAVLAGSVEESAALAAGIPDARLQRFNAASEAVKALSQGQVQAVALSQPSLRGMMLGAGPDAQHWRVQTLGGSAGKPAFAFRPADHEMRDAVNGVLERFLGSSAHHELVAPFGFTGDRSEALARGCEQ